jgi:signal transduction histidine kinase
MCRSANVSTFCLFGGGGEEISSPNLGSDAMGAWISALLIAATVFLTPLEVTAQEGRPRSILVLDQSDLRGPFYYSAFSGLRSALSNGGRSHITLYAESLHANRLATAGKLTSTIAHELNQPLSTILTNTGTAELILNSPSPELSEMNSGSSAVISISDSGPGIPAEKLNEVFDPFFTTKRQGMGIGLSISRTIVQAHKGPIWAKNQKEGGAVFRLSLLPKS